MDNLGLNELREEFLTFFTSKGHLRLKSFSLVPQGDKSLLLINAGMAPLKPYFLGKKKMSKDRVCSSQRCVRTADIDNVGKTARHATFFEMLGNFSFGDYFKKEAIHWGYEFLTDRVGLDPDLFWVTVYKDDDEAYRIWAEEVGIPEERILRLDKDENFWELDQGPCGPCSEIHYDRGPAYGEGTSPLDNSDRFMEVWNLVFTQFDRSPEGDYTPLANPNIDTGMGLERLALITENKSNIFELEEFLPIRDEIERLSKKKYGEKNSWDRSFRIIIDHSKAISFLVMDGVVPSNEGRGYVLRRLVRRAYRHGKLLGIEGEFLTQMIDQLVPVYKSEYPDLETSLDRIKKIVVREEDQFQETIDSGLNLLENLIKEKEEKGEKTLDGQDVFKLYDTYGFPPDLTEEIAGEEGMDLDHVGFQKAMDHQKAMSRQGRKGGKGWEEDQALDLEGLEESQFTGYERTEDQGQVLALFKGEDGQDGRVDQLEPGDRGLLVLDKTPFYAESGGQVGDLGIIKASHCKVRVLDTSKDVNKIYFHHIKVEEGKISVGDKLEARVDRERRMDIRRNHSSTHLLHKALKIVLGDHVNQAGSYVDDQGLRFDFSHYEPVSPEDLNRVEQIVNEEIFKSLPVRTEILPYDEAVDQGAVGLFEDKYQDQVRVVSMGDFSKELCGGTHVDNTAQISMFRILSEQGISSGVRRIMAVTGRSCYQLLKDQDQTLEEIAGQLKTKPEEITSRIDKVLAENKEVKNELASFQSRAAADQSHDLLDRAEDLDGVSLIKAKLDGYDMDQLKSLSDQVKAEASNYILVLAGIVGEKLYWLVSLDKELIKQGLKAGNIVKYLSKMTSGGGGGRPDFASGGGKDISRVDEALDTVDDYIRQERK